MHITLRSQDGQVVANPALVPPVQKLDQAQVALISGAGRCAGSLLLHLFFNHNEIIYE